MLLWLRFWATQERIVMVLGHSRRQSAVNSTEFEKTRPLLEVEIPALLLRNETKSQKFRNKNGVLFYYVQEISHNSKAEKWAVLASYFTVHCWKSLIYDFYNKEGGKYDNILAYENLERKGEDLTEIGFEKLTPYNLYIDSPIELPEYFLYYNLFTY